MYFLVTIGGSIYSASVQRFSVAPNELNREQQYILNNIEATRRAYALDRVEEHEHTGDSELTAKDVIANAATVENVRLWTTSRCSRPSDRFRKSARTTSSRASTTTGTRLTASTARSCSRSAS
jgi:uncharacterized membrane protein (UPF0182 family)